MDDAPPAAGKLAKNILYFARALREAGLPVGPGGVLDALAAVEAAGVGDRGDFHATLHAVFVKKHEHSLLFDQAFRIFWRRKGFLEKLIAMMSPQARSGKAHATRPRRARPASPTRCSRRRKAKPRPRRRSISTRASPCRPTKSLRTKDFAQMSAAEIARAKAQIVSRLDAAERRA